MANPLHADNLHAFVLKVARQRGGVASGIQEQHLFGLGTTGSVRSGQSQKAKARDATRLGKC